MSTLTEDQRKLCLEVADRLDAWPETHSQHDWYDHYTWGREAMDGSDLCTTLYGTPHPGRTAVVDLLDMAECGTTACLAGHALIAAHDLGMLHDDDPGRSSNRYGIADSAARLLGLSNVDPGWFDADVDEADVRWAVRTAADTGRWPERWSSVAISTE